MRRLFFGIGLAALLLTAVPASAATIIGFDTCSTASLCNQLTLSASLNGSAIDVTVTAPAGYGLFGSSNGNHAFGLNVQGSGVTLSNFNSGFSFAGTNDNINGYGIFEYLIDGPQQGSASTLPLTFTVTRTGGFSSELQLFEMNAAGYLAAAHLRNSSNGVTGFVAANDPPTTNSPVPEPASMLLLGTGLAAAYRARRKAGL